ncbi:MAG: HAD-IA family hydrolase [Burkholderiales bacterium]|nr:HAD-IA family hydrolase [Burkholderiales bacterium]MDP2398771.1 HAD-IA family hydrolase [Burkholderiales bacterium]
MMIRKFQLLVFDWDGTLMDSAAAIAESLQAACAELGVPVPDDTRARYGIGLGLTDALAHAVPDLEPAQYPRLLELYRRHFLRRNDGTTLFGGAAEMIHELHDRGFLLAVATGKSRRGLDRALLETGLAGYFHATRCADEGFSKPHPGMLHAVMDSLAAIPEETVMIGDTTHDLEMADAAGVASVAVTYGAHERTALSACKPLAMLDEVRVLHDWLLLQR